MSLIVVLGFDGPGASANPFPVYTGRKSAEADEAMASSDAVRFEIIKNPVTLRKRGLRYAAKMAAAEAEAAAEAKAKAAAEADAAPMTAAEILEAAVPEKDADIIAAEVAALSADIEAAEADTDAPAENPDPDSAAPAVSGKRKK